MIRFKKTYEVLYLQYSGEADPSSSWLIRKFKDGEEHIFRNTFTLSLSDLENPEIRIEDIGEDESGYITLNGDYYDGDFEFRIGFREGEYYRLDTSVFDTKNTFYIHNRVPLQSNFFVANRDISILRRLDKLVSQDVYIGGPAVGALPIDAYRQLLRNFPTSTELNRYSAARIDACIRDYLETTRDHTEAYQTHLSRRIAHHPSNLLPRFAESELAKYTEILNHLNQMLAAEESYTEAQWQQEILAIIQLVFPKYIRIFENVKIRDTVNNKNRFIDFILIDAAGHIDLIEIKKPFDRCILSKVEYRQNYVPTKELSGSIMQLEKYIFYLNKLGGNGEKVLSKRYQNKLPPGMSLKIVNPQGIAILGRENNLSQHQRQDFEVVKRKYRNIVDIITYDDLFARIKSVIDSFSDFTSD